MNIINLTQKGEKVKDPNAHVAVGVGRGKNITQKKNNFFFVVAIILPITVIILLLITFFAIVIYRANVITNNNTFITPSTDDKIGLTKLLNEEYKNERSLVRPLPYEVIPANLAVDAKGAICVNTSNGCVIWEKNADEVIPPASTTKMFVMYIVFEELEKGVIHLDDIVPLPKECLAINMMPHSSLMFLGEFQKVTLEQLMIGLCVDSGNDAAYALAFYVIQKEDELHGLKDPFDANSAMERFVGRMNEVAKDLGLTHTHFVESSGYSENNLTTARELATFCTSYVTRFPQCLKYHSTREFTWSGIFQANSNPLLRILKGCDGLKTGYIIESGYNLALTVKRGDTRIVCVTLGGKGVGGRQGNAGRIHDNTAMVNYAYDCFVDQKLTPPTPIELPVIYGQVTRVKLVPAFTMKTLTIPKSILKNDINIADQLKITVESPKALAAPINMGDALAAVSYKIGEHTLLYIPLVAENSIEKNSKLFCTADYFARFFL